uniref:Uncharacterized protein n=1 Tax=Pyxicephalus adspersus TaxID=30357 RepID=A0AAV3APW4_PYXAD|nr:TPA: hypothetical protein GDO54_001122 [Pyxicephalus adspersus]
MKKPSHKNLSLPNKQNLYKGGLYILFQYYCKGEEKCIPGRDPREVQGVLKVIQVCYIHRAFIFECLPIISVIADSSFWALHTSLGQ